MTPFDRAEYDALPEVLTTAQVARLLDMTEVQVRHWAIEGTIPCTRIGRALRFSKSRLVRWVMGDTPL